MPKILSELIEVYIFRRVSASIEYLILQRASDESLYPNMWQIVTGTLKKKENALKGARRELKEETGLRYRHFWTVPLVNSFYDSTRDVIQMNTLFAAEVDTASNPVLSTEHQQYVWLTYSDARKKLVWPEQRSGLEIVNTYIAGGEEASRLTEIIS